MTKISEQNLKRLLLVLSVIDLAFGTASMFLEPIEWQICALISSLCTFMCLLVLIIAYRNTFRSNITTLILGLIDICFGALSIALMAFTLKALIVTVSALRTFKVGKIVVQGSKALKLSQSTSPIVKKVAIRFLPLFISLIRNHIIDRGKNMAEASSTETKKVEVKNFFPALGKFIANNWQTLLGIIAGVYCVLEGEFHWIGNALAGVSVNPHIAYAIMSPLYGFIANALVKHGIEFGKSKQVRELAKAIGVEDAYIGLQNAYTEAKQAEEAKKAEEEAKAKAEAERAELKALVAEEAAKAEAEERAQANRIKAQEIRRKYLDDVSRGKFVGTLDEWFEQVYSVTDGATK